ncbi:MAG: GAF domain-containing protein [Candidatus Thermoplasmatota archaeon]|nr:GAF domain-containing protein [Candidatus Thermoplasmatota archaeon]
MAGNIPKLGEHRFSLFDLVPDDVSVIRNDRTITFLNSRMRERYGDLTGKKCFETSLSSPEVCGGCPLRSDVGSVRYPHKRTVHTSGGRVLDITTNRYEDIDASGSYMVCVIHDATERRDGELHTDRLTSSLDHMSEAIALFDVDGRVVYANHSFSIMMDIEMRDALGKPLGALTEGSSIDLPVSRILSSRENSGWSGETSAVTKDGSKSFINIDARPVHDRIGKVIGIVANFRDITQERQEKAETDRYRSQLEKRMEQRTTELAHRVNQLTLINKISRVVTSILDPNDLMQEFTKSISSGFGYPIVAILLWDMEKGELHYKAGAGSDVESFLGHRGQKMKEGLIGHAAYFSETLVTGDVDADPRFIRGYVADTKSEIAVPLTYRGELIGVLDIQSDRRDAFTRSDVTVLEMLADILSTALINARTFSELKERENALSVLDRVSKQISMRLEPKIIFNQIAKDAASLLNAEKALVGLVDPDKDFVDWVALHNVDAATMEELRSPTESGVSGRVLKRGTAEIVNDYEFDPDAVPRDANLMNLTSMVSAPLMGGGRPVGVINVYNCRDSGGFRKSDAVLLSSLADHVAIALENANLLSDLNTRIRSQLTLLDTAVSLQRGTDSSSIYQTVAEKLGEVVWYDGVSVYKVDHENKMMVPVVAIGRNASEIMNEVFSINEGLSGHVAQTGVAEVVNDTLTDDRASLVSGTEDDVEREALMAVPMKGRDGVIAVLAMYRETGGKFSIEERDIALLFANQAAVAVENFELSSSRERMLEETQIKILQMTKVLEVTTSIMYMDDIDSVLQRVSEAVVESFGFKRAEVLMLDETTGEFIISGLSGFPEWIQRGTVSEMDVAVEGLRPEFKVGETAHYMPYERQQFDVDRFYFLANPGLADRPRESPDAWHERDLLVFAMKDRSNQVIGYMLVDEPTDLKVPKKEQIEVLEILAGMASIAVVNFRLFENQVDAVNEIALLNDLMTHDINNFNQGIMGYLELLLEDEHLQDNPRKYAERALVQVRNNAGLIDNMRTLAKVRTADEKDYSSQDLGLAVNDAITVVERMYTDRQVIVTSLIPPKECFVRANKFLRELFVNVLSNAVKFDQSMRVKVNVSVDQESTTDGEYWHISISDYGRGVPDDRKKTVFERFATGMTGVKGFGLGLSIVSTMVDRFGGRIWIEDRVPGDYTKGAVFRITLPKAEAVDE